MKRAMITLMFCSLPAACGSSSADGGEPSAMDVEVADVEVTDSNGGDSAPGDAAVADSAVADSAAKDSTSTDTFVAPPDSIVPTDAPVDDGVAPIDPVCARHTYGIDVFSNLSRADALDVPFDYDVHVSGQRPDGDASGTVEKQYFKLVVTTPRKVDVTFSGLNAYAGFYFESETTSRFSVGATMYRKSGQLLDVGTYYVQIGDIYSRYAGSGPLFDVYVRWSDPPTPCVVD
jgi:hypothetical protein